MIEWYSKTPKNEDKRITRRFALFPERCHNDTWVWLEFYYIFEEYEASNFQYYTYGTQPHWVEVNRLSKSQFTLFKKNLALHLTDTNIRLREFAELVQVIQLKK